jgi:CRP-like cAMP-binding protein
MDKSQFLSGIEMFKGFTGPELQRLASAAREVVLKDEHPLIKQGDKGLTVLIVTQGTAEVVKAGPAGKKKTLAELGPGSVLGEMSVMTGDPATADVVARGTVNALSISGAVFSQIVRKNQKVLARISRDMAKRYSRIARQ